MHYIHTNKVIHRDMKAANLLVSNTGFLKIGDWGLSRSWVNGGRYTTRVVTLWYRAPELLLGVKTYTPAIDLWAVGCIFAELLGKKSILPGKDEAMQLKLILTLCGTPTKEEWPEFESLVTMNKLNLEKYTRTLEKRFIWMKPDALDLLKSLLCLNPSKRISAADALDHDYFWKGTVPSKPEDLPKIEGPGLHEFELKEQRARLREEQQKQHQQQQHQQQNWRGRGRGGRGRGRGRGGYHSHRGRTFKG
uniref:Cyclin-dependent kinase 2 homolog n=1 Tax=Aplanochytrium stocchinoi TaxID=215587 RepID=A0A7S3PLL6_9STRA